MKTPQTSHGVLDIKTGKEITTLPWPSAQRANENRIEKHKACTICIPRNQLLSGINLRRW